MKYIFLLATFLLNFNVSAVTIHNQLLNTVDYTIYTNSTLTKCAEGTITPGDKAIWQTAGSVINHPLCGGTTGPTHVEVHINVHNGTSTICLERGTNEPRIINNNGRVLIKNTQQKLSCHTL